MDWAPCFIKQLPRLPLPRTQVRGGDRRFASLMASASFLHFGRRRDLTTDAAPARGDRCPHSPTLPCTSSQPPLSRSPATVLTSVFPRSGGRGAFDLQPWVIRSRRSTIHGFHSILVLTEQKQANFTRGSKVSVLAHPPDALPDALQEPTPAVLRARSDTERVLSACRSDE